MNISSHFQILMNLVARKAPWRTDQVSRPAAYGARPWRGASRAVPRGVTRDDDTFLSNHRHPRRSTSAAEPRGATGCAISFSR
jgi:hypothetical protein